MNLHQTMTILIANPTLLTAMVSIFALSIGSFLNVVIHRLPKMIDGDAINLATPRSHCPHCNTAIPWTSNIPVISYLVLQGQCENCEHPISIRYPIVELATLIITLACLLKFGVSIQLLGASVLCWALIALFIIDIEQQLLPDTITLPLLWAGLWFNLGNTFCTLSSAVIGATIGYLFLWLIGWSYKWLRGIDGIGYGDYKLLAAIGAWLGWQALPQVILLGSGAGVVFSITMMLMNKQHYYDRIAFGPFLISAAVLTLFFGVMF